MSDLPQEVAESMEKLGLSLDKAKPRMERVYEAMVELCRESDDLPRITDIARRAGVARGSMGHIMPDLIAEGRVYKLADGKYVPIVED